MSGIAIFSILIEFWPKKVEYNLETQGFEQFLTEATNSKWYRDKL